MAFGYALQTLHSLQERGLKEARRTFLASPPGMSLWARAHVAPHAHAVILARRTADGCCCVEQTGQVGYDRSKVSSLQPLWGSPC